MDEGSSPSGKDMEWRANAAIGELLAVIRDAKSRDAEVGFKSTMWEAEARTWKERWARAVGWDLEGLMHASSQPLKCILRFHTHF